MRWLVITLTLMAARVYGADFRVLDFEETCAHAGQREGALGSRQIGWNPSGPEYLAFQAQEFERQVSVLYFCPKGVLFTGNYFFPTEGFDDALESFRSLYDSLNSTYGEPFLDNTPWQRNSDRRFVSPDPHRYMVTWKSSRVQTTMSVMRGHDKSDSTWHVFVVVRKNKP
jgi:hypothetical protein